MTREIRVDENPREYKKMLNIHKIAETGKSIEDGMGSERRVSGFEDLVFLPAQLSKMPLLDEEPISLTTIIGSDAEKPLKLKVPFMISGMSFGALSREVKITLAKASAEVGTSANSGEGGMLDEERKFADKYIIQLSSGRFGQTEDRLKQADAIEIKISQSAKPGKGGVLRASKVTDEIAEVRGVKKGEDVISPAKHPDINSAKDLKNKITELRKMSGGVPIGVKIAGGQIEKDLKVILDAEPDYVVIDGFGGGTGAAPGYIKNHFGIPHPAFLVRTVKFIKEYNSKRKISIIVAGKFRTSADIAKAIALGADAVYLATAVLMALGCEQYRLCNIGTCPKAIATQNPIFREGYDESERLPKVVNFFNVLSKEIKDVARIIGEDDIHNINSENLAALTLETAKSSGVKYINY